MLRNPLPTLKRGNSSPEADLLNHAEQGFKASLLNLPKARQPLSLRCLLRRSISTPAGAAFGDTHEIKHNGSQSNPLPTQEPPCGAIVSATGCESIMQRFSFSRTRSCKETTTDPLEEYRPGYAKFKDNHYQNFPNGWPRVAAFLDGCDSFGIYRRFSTCHARLLVAHMTDITDMESQLLDLDRSDEAGSTSWRLKNRYHEKGFDTTKRDLLQRIETKLLAYDALLLNQRRLRALDRTPAKDHNSVFQWIWANKPLDDNEFDWIFHPEDFVSMVPPRRNWFENFIRDHLDARPKSYFKRFFKAGSRPNQSSDSEKLDTEEVDIFSTARIITFARFIVVLFAVLVLLIPVLLFLMTSMSRASMAIVVLLFVFIFSIIMSLLTDAAIPEIFIGTSTYCAVLVTFLGNLQNARS